MFAPLDEIVGGSCGGAVDGGGVHGASGWRDSTRGGGVGGDGGGGSGGGGAHTTTRNHGVAVDAGIGTGVGVGVGVGDNSDSGGFSSAEVDPMRTLTPTSKLLGFKPSNLSGRSHSPDARTHLRSLAYVAWHHLPRRCSGCKGTCATSRGTRETSQRSYGGWTRCGAGWWLNTWPRGCTAQRAPPPRGPNSRCGAGGRCYLTSAAIDCLSQVGRAARPGLPTGGGLRMVQT